MYIVQCKVHIVQCTVCSVHFTLSAVGYIVCTKMMLNCTIKYRINIIIMYEHCTNIQYILYTIYTETLKQYTVYIDYNAPTIRDL